MTYKGTAGIAAKEQNQQEKTGLKQEKQKGRRGLEYKDDKGR